MQKYFFTIKRLWKLFKPFQKYIYLQVAIIFSVQFFSIATSVVNSKFITSLVAKNINIAITLFLAWILLRFIEAVSEHFKVLLQEKYLDQNIAQYLQEYSLRRILSLTIKQHVEEHSAIKQQIISRGEASAEQVIQTIFTSILPIVLYILIALATLTYYSTTLGLLSVLVMITLLFWIYRFRLFHQVFVKKNRDNWIEQNKLRTEAFTHLPLVKYFSQENYFIKKYIADRKKYVEHHVTTRRYAIKHGFKRSLFAQSSEMVSLGIASLFFITGGFEIGALYLVLSLNSRMYNQIGMLSGSLRDLPIWLLDVERYLEAVDKTPEFTENGETPSLDGNIIFNNVTFSYPHGDAVYSHVSFTIPQGKKTAFVGSSGSGKSTTIKLLMRAYDYTSGSITINNTELSHIDANHLRHNIGYVEQHVDLLDDTVKENILFGVTENKRSAAIARLEETAVRSRIDQFYHRLGEKKFNTHVGERGVKLSGGERQRIGIARAIIKNPDILIFDEATSSLDTENEKYVMDAIADVSKGKTTIIIAHRLSTVRDADKIIIMDKGHVVGEGTHDELMSTNAIYQNLVAHQLS